MSFRRRVAYGVAWTAAYQVFSLLLSLVSVLTIARMVPPPEFGLFAMTLLPLAAINGLSTTSVVTHALFRGRDDEPDWNLYLWLGLLAQSAAAILCNLVALTCWFVPEYRPMAPLLHAASIGVVIDAFVRLDSVFCQRHLDMRRNQVLLAACDVLSLATVLTLALLGFGAWGLLIGSNVVRGLPFVIHLFFVRRFRPEPSRWMTYTKADLLPPVKFALHYSAANAGNALRQFAESALIPLAFTAAQVGLVSRAIGLYGQTAGRAVQGINETATAALLALASEPDRLRRGATIYLKVIGGLLIAAVGMLAAAGPTLSAVLYGPGWKEADPFILPGAIHAAAVFFAAVCSTTLLASGRQRANLLLLASLAVAAVPSLIALAARTTPHVYLWTQAASFTFAAAFALSLCRPVVGLRNIVTQLAPAVVAAIAAGGICFLVDQSLQNHSKWWRLPTDVAAFGLVHLAVMRFAFPRWLAESLDIVPKGNLVRRWLRLGEWPASGSRPPTQDDPDDKRSA